MHFLPISSIAVDNIYDKTVINIFLINAVWNKQMLFWLLQQTILCVIK